MYLVLFYLAYVICVFLSSLFSCCTSADWVLFWPSDPKTDQNSSQAQDLLRCEIVNPLRRSVNVCVAMIVACCTVFVASVKIVFLCLCVFVFLRYGYVCASKTMALRRLLEAANSDTGFTSQEKGMQLPLGVLVLVCVHTEECCHAAFVLSVRSGGIPEQAFPAPPSRAAPQDQVISLQLFIFFQLTCSRGSHTFFAASHILAQPASLSHRPG